MHGWELFPCNSKAEQHLCHGATTSPHIPEAQPVPSNRDEPRCFGTGVKNINLPNGFQKCEDVK